MEVWENTMGGVCRFNEEIIKGTPFTVAYNNAIYSMDIEWDYCDGKTLWARVND